MGVEGERLAGHAPATMIGGMRHGGHMNKSSQEKEIVLSEKDQKDTISNENNPHDQTANAGHLVNAQPIRIQDAFPTDAVKKMHGKHFPTHEKGSPRQTQGQLFQPQMKSMQ